MKSQQLKNSRLTLCIVALVFAIATAFIFLRLKNKKIPACIKISENIYQFGKVQVNKSKNIIEFSAKVAKTSGYVDFLLYVDGYKWLKTSCAIISNVKLSNLQNAIAFLNWELWDELWVKGEVSSASPPEIFIRCDNVDNEAVSFVNVGDEILEIGDFVFLGSPYFDPVVLQDKSTLNCEKCPIYEIEERALRKRFIRSSGRSGYELNQKSMPPEGENVIVVLKLALLPKSTE